MPSAPSVAVIDIGSNSIKVLVATRGADGSIMPLKFRTIDARIGTGISLALPRLNEEGMKRGVEAIAALLQDAAEYSPARVVLVATSAVRDAQNGSVFRDQIRAATGQETRVLSGAEEANLIGRGLTCDPALRELRNFYVFDLGGGSLECLAFRDRQIAQEVSLQLGCVRLTERFVADVTAPFTSQATSLVAAHTREVLAQSGFTFSLPESAVAIGTGGTITTVRAILGARAGKPFEQTNPIVTTAELQGLLAWLGALPLADRKNVPGLPPTRADVFPTALATFLAVAEAGRFTAFQNSLFNLRFGLADQALG